MIFSLKATEHYLFETVMNRVRTLQVPKQCGVQLAIGLTL